MYYTKYIGSKLTEKKLAELIETGINEEVEQGSEYVDMIVNQINYTVILLFKKP
ncbi:MAG: hypothetical protein LBL23_08170 [Coriobacteriales bacterium]|jgi:ribosomal protein S18 acetylase RimI-like enzyme|nr:hypothetical protein [Coriobacteriales bacterium]